MTDRRSRLHRLAVRIENDQLKVQYPNLPQWAWRYRRQAARYLALVEKETDQIGTDPKASPRRVTGLQKAAEAQLKKLQALATQANGHHGGPSLEEIRGRYVRSAG